MANYEQPAFVDERVRFFDGQFLKDQDFIDEQKYHLDRVRRYARFLNVAGIVEGFTVEAGRNLVTVKPGTALDHQGRQVVLSEPRPVALEDYKGTVDLVVAYREEPTRKAAGGEGTRFRETPYVGPRDRAPSQVDALVLARLVIDAKGDVAVDTSVRVASGLRLPDGRSADAGTWPALRVHDGAVALTGNLRLTRGTLNLDGDQQVIFADDDNLTSTLKVQLFTGYGLGINQGTLFYAARLRHSWRDAGGANERMALTTGPDGGLTVKGAGDSSLAGRVGIGIEKPEEKLHVKGGKIKLDGDQQLMFTDAGPTTALKVQLGSGCGLGIAGDAVFYAANGRHSWRDQSGANERMALTTKPDGGLALTGTGESSFAGSLRILAGSNPVRFTSGWSNFPNEGGADAKRNQAEISNDTSDYKALMIVGNRSNDKAVRRVQVWDRLEVQGSLKVTGTIEAEGHILGKDALVKGLIMMWYGEVDAIPAGWVLCDGTHETPDLRGRFVVGYHPDDVDYKVRGSKGGAKTHTLTLEEMPAHAHNGSTSSSTLTIPRGGGLGGSNALASTTTTGWGPAEFSHSHTLTTDSRGGGKAFDHRPPYYVLAFIMYTGG